MPKLDRGLSVLEMLIQSLRRLLGRRRTVGPGSQKAAAPHIANDGCVGCHARRSQIDIESSCGAPLNCTKRTHPRAARLIRCRGFLCGGICCARGIAQNGR